MSVVALKTLYTANLSKGGLAVFVSEPIAVDQPVKLLLQLPGYKIHLDATVRHCTPSKGGTDFRIGLQFDRLTDAQRGTIERIIGQMD